MLQQFLGADGWPDPARFRAVVSGTFDRVAAAVGTTRPRIAAFGEMVALLCSGGRFAVANRLEELWNEVASEYCFSLLCAYPMSLFKTDANAAARFMKICAQHSHVFSADRRNALTRPRFA
jgi:DcmR-like sensory protein